VAGRRSIETSTYVKRHQISRISHIHFFSTLRPTTPFFSPLRVEDYTNSIPANHLFLYISVLYFIHISHPHQPPSPHSCLFPCLLYMPTSSMLGHTNLQPKCSAWFENVIFLCSWQYNPSVLIAYFP